MSSVFTVWLRLIWKILWKKCFVELTCKLGRWKWECGFRFAQLFQMTGKNSALPNKYSLRIVLASISKARARTRKFLSLLFSHLPQNSVISEFIMTELRRDVEKGNFSICNLWILVQGQSDLVAKIQGENKNFLSHPSQENTLSEQTND